MMNNKIRTYTEQEAFIKLSALCASAEYCEEDIRKKMKNWLIADSKEEAEIGKDEDRKENIIIRLVSEHYIDNKRYAHAFVRDKFRYNHWGRVRIAQELRMRKIESSIINEALEEIPEDDNQETLRKLIEGKKKSVKGKNDYEIKCKLMRFALGRGFQMSDIVKVIGDIDDTD